MRTKHGSEHRLAIVFSMANPDHLAKLKKGVEVWNQWRSINPDVEPDLSMVDLKGADLSGANLSRLDFTKANLSNASLFGATLRAANLYKIDLTSAHLNGATLREADLHGATLTSTLLHEADLTRANLSGATLIAANLHGTNLSGATLTGANLNGVFLLGTILVNLSLNDVQGLDNCRHVGASTIDFRTLANSPQLPLSFLQGCGLPNTLIEYLPSLLSGGSIQFYSCFISYSTKDQPFAERLHADLQNKGVRCWFAPHKVQGGKKIHEQIDEAIRVYDRLLLILSDASIHSDWVETEISKARKRERRESRRMLFPVRLVDFETLRNWECFDADTGKDSAREIREYFVPDFSNWKDHDSYQAGFQRLLKDLEIEPSSEGIGGSRF